MIRVAYAFLTRIRKYRLPFFILLTVHLFTNSYQYPNLRTFSCIYLVHLSTCFEHYSAHHQEIELY